MQESRLFKIVYHLLDKGHATAPEPAKKLEVSVRTIYRDIEALSEAGIPVYAETGRGGGIHLMPEFVLGKVMLSEREKRIAGRFTESNGYREYLSGQLIGKTDCAFFKRSNL